MGMYFPFFAPRPAMIPSEIETRTAYVRDNNSNDNVRGKHLSAPLVCDIHDHCNRNNND